MIPSQPIRALGRAPWRHPLRLAAATGLAIPFLLGNPTSAREFSGLGAISGTVASAEPAASVAGAEAVDQLAEDLIATARLPGLSVAILRDGQIVYANGFGFADLEARTPVTPDTRYRCASVSKVITATAVARLVQDGRLELDAPVTRYVPEWPGTPVVTPRLVSGHLAGVAHYQRQDRIDRTRHYATFSESLDVFRDSPRAGEPGERYVYSTHGYTLLSGIVEGASGLPFLEYLEARIFGPLGMRASGPDLRASPDPTMSTLYGREDGRPVAISQPEDPSYKWGGGGLISTPSDLVRLADAYLNGFIDPVLVDEMWTTQRTRDGEETGVGIAWRIGEDRAGRRVVHHSGSMGGARSTLVIYPDRHEAIAVMTNVVWPSDIQRTGELLLEAYRAAEAGARSGASTGGDRLYRGTLTRTHSADSVTVAEASGSISLVDGDGWISTPDPLAEWTDDMTVERMPLRHVEGETYLLVMPYGLAPVELRATEQGLRGLARPSPAREWVIETEGP